MTLTVVTPTVPDRRYLLDDLLQSMQAQRRKPERHLVGVDFDREGPGPVVNRLVEDTDTEWVFRADDDDVFDPDHFEVLYRHLDDDVDVVYSWCRIEGRAVDGLDMADQFQIPWQADLLRERNFVPCSAAVRRSVWLDAGGYRDVDDEDWDLWLRLLDAGREFRCVPAVTWTYRLSDEWEHRSVK